MSTTDDIDIAQKIHLEDIPPTHCSSCYGQYPERRHVDFGATWDGPVFPSGEVVGGTPVTIDELVICEACLKVASELVGQGDVEEYAERIQQLTYELEDTRTKLTMAIGLNKTLEAAASQREDLEKKLAVKS